MTMPAPLQAAAEFSRNDLALVATTLHERYGHEVAIEAVEVELAPEPDARTATPWPALYWQQRGAEFVVVKLGPDCFRPRFFYANGEQFGTGRDDYANLGDCLISVLQVQADDERRRAAAGSGSREEAPADYSGPLVI